MTQPRRWVDASSFLEALEARRWGDRRVDGHAVVTTETTEPSPPPDARDAPPPRDRRRAVCRERDRRVLALLAEAGPLTRAQVAERLDLPVGLVSGALWYLRFAGRVALGTRQEGYLWRLAD